MLLPFAAQAKPIHIVALGDSLTAGYNLPAPAAFASALERRLRAAGFAVDIDNAGVSGDTARDGLARLDWSVPENADLVIVELGANDMLRGIAPDVARKSLDEIVQRLVARKHGVVLAGMRSMANWGDAYRTAFDAIYPDLAARYKIPLYPFFLEGVTGHADLTLPDGLHPNAVGVERIVDHFLPFLQPILMERFGAPQTPSSQAPSRN